MSDARRRYEELKKNPIALDITRGKPSAEQLDLSNGMLSILGPQDFRGSDGSDCRNYSGLEGLPEARALFADILEVPRDQVMVAGTSSLALMHESMIYAVLQGVPDGSGPWSNQRAKFLCPSPGYDRHFAICEHLGIEMITVPMTPQGPDMAVVEKLAATDPSIKGIWTVPKYSNPTGVTFAPEVVSALAKMKTAAPDFRVIWDNAYAVHDLGDSPDVLANGSAAGEAAGNPNRFLVFGSFAKITFAGSGMTAIAGSKANLDWWRKHYSKNTISSDNLNQLRHVRFFKEPGSVRAHMKKHAAIMGPKFDCVQRVLERELGGTGLATWTKPRGGYFVSMDTKPGKAAQAIKLAADVGLKVTPAGSTFPLRKDPEDRNIRIAPSFASLKDLERAVEVLAVSIQCAG